MTRWLKRTLIGIFGTAALLGGMAAWAHHGHGRHGWQAMSEQDAAAMKTRIVDKVGRRLDLDAAQKAKLGLLADSLSEQRKALVGAGIDPRAQLQSLITGSTFDRAKAGALIAGKVDAVQSKSPAVVAAMADFYDSLNPAQQAKVREFMAHRHG